MLGAYRNMGPHAAAYSYIYFSLMRPSETEFPLVLIYLVVVWGV